MTSASRIKSAILETSASAFASSYGGRTDCAAAAATSASARIPGRALRWRRRRRGGGSLSGARLESLAVKKGRSPTTPAAARNPSEAADRVARGTRRRAREASARSGQHTQQREREAMACASPTDIAELREVFAKELADFFRFFHAGGVDDYRAAAASFRRRRRRGGGAVVAESRRPRPFGETRFLCRRRRVLLRARARRPAAYGLEIRVVQRPRRLDLRARGADARARGLEVAVALQHRRQRREGSNVSQARRPRERPAARDALLQTRAVAGTASTWRTGAWRSRPLKAARKPVGSSRWTAPARRRKGRSATCRRQGTAARSTPKRSRRWRCTKRRPAARRASRARRSRSCGPSWRSATTRGVGATKGPGPPSTRASGR